MDRRRHASPAIGLAIALSLVPAAPAGAQVVVKVNEETFFKLGLLLQTQADAAQETPGGAYAQNLFVRRVRLLLGGQIAPNLTFFVETDSPNLGKSTSAGTKNAQPAIYLQDAYVEWKLRDAIAIDAGLMLISPSRNGLQSAASLLPIDYGPHTFANSAATQSNVGRDTGVQLKGHLADGRLEYRAGVFQGMRDTPERELRLTARVQYAFFEKEGAFFYTGTYLGKKRVLTAGAGIDRQDGYTGYAVDLFLDLPLRHGALTTQLDHIRYDGGTFLVNLKEQQATLFQAGYLIGGTRVQPVLQYARRTFANGGGIGENRVGGGINYYINGHTANVKALYTRIDSGGARATSQFTVQIQFFYF